MSERIAFTGAEVFDGHTHRGQAALLIESDRVTDVVERADIPEGYAHVVMDGGTILPGLVDLQVNGGGGVMLNSRPDVEAIKTLCAAHAACGTSAILPTLITDTREVMHRAVEAAVEATRRAVPGMIGLHLEGPHLAVSRKGAHMADLIRPMDEDDLIFLEQTVGELPTLMVTLAPESVTEDQVARLTAAGMTVSLGHSDTSYAAARRLVGSGARCVTHLFNAMSQISSREPGLVGVALESPELSAGLIADGHHVSIETINIALRSKVGPGRIFLVSDAMAVTGTSLTEFTLNGRRILRGGGRLTLEDGTLAGADLYLLSAVDFICHRVGLTLEEGFRMASLYPAQVIGREGEFGALKPGARANFLWLDADGKLGCTYIDGRRAHGAAP